MSNIKGPLISSQRYLDKAKVSDRAARFKRFIVSVYPIVLRGQQYTILMDGHHNYAAAKLAGIEPDYRPITKRCSVFSVRCHGASVRHSSSTTLQTATTTLLKQAKWFMSWLCLTRPANSTRTQVTNGFWRCSMTVHTLKQCRPNQKKLSISEAVSCGAT